MHKTKCLIVDDEPVAQRIIENYLIDLREYDIVAKCLNAIEARQVLIDQKVDLLFLDLEMPKLKGFPFLKTLDNPPAVIITTAYREFALEGYEHNVLDYLLKPISFERFIQAIDKYKNTYQASTIPIERIIKESEANYLIVRSERKNIKLLQEQILYIKGLNNYIQFFTQDDKYMVYSSLQDIISKLDNRFLRVHRSYIVNKNKVTAHSNEKVELGEISIPVGVTFRKEVKNLYL